MNRKSVLLGAGVSVAVLAAVVGLAVLAWDTIRPHPRVRLIYAVPAEIVGQLDQKKLMSHVLRRIDPQGVFGYRVSVTPQGRLEVLVTDQPKGTDAVARVKRLLARRGVLEFRFVADSTRAPGKEEAERFTQLKQEGKPSDDPRFRWYRTADAFYLNYVRGALPPGWITIVDEQNQTVKLLIDVSDGQNVTGTDLAGAYRDTDTWGAPVIGFRIKRGAQERFALLTKPENRGRYLAIILDGTVQSAPVLRAQLSSGGIIEGYRNKERERDEVVTILNTGQLSTGLDLVGEEPLGDRGAGGTTAAPGHRSKESDPAPSGTLK